MKAILQRVLSASVTVEKEVVSSIGKGVLVFAAVAPGDTQKEADSLAAKVLKMKLWDDDAGNRFTLLASTKKGNKPDFHGAASGEEAKRLYQYFFEKVRQGYAPGKVQNGVFQAMMEVALVNDGPVTLEISALPKADPKATPSPSPVPVPAP
ncbi:hypothetical protein EKO27_g8449 [Xylaria grammica]|uniref:D-aminoacyl-tRNA deacylase n=1 Tax=Xylaria grammica TaxID=363999 RepID=A0A439CXB6_9PEZI|nr:hypothetical protein EKO27_g8449 [Xylaria grammica]